MTPRTYDSPPAFKAALETRLRASSKGGLDVGRRRQLLVFERFLARIVAVLDEAATLEGGLVLELRLARARTTKDVDLRVVGVPSEVLAKLQEAARLDLGDFMTFEIAPDEDEATIDGDGVRYEGQRFRAECRLAGKLYGNRFGVDVAFGDPMITEPDVITSEDFLGFAGVPPPRVRVYPVETHLAEKLHAYTLPRERLNSRVKDLPDIALLAMAGALDARRLRAALEQTFDFRKSHPLPGHLPEPPPAWEPSYAEMARRDALTWTTLAAVTAAARAFMDLVLAGDLDATWSPDAWTWRSR